MPEQATAEPLVEVKEIESAEAFERRIAERGFVSELTRFFSNGAPGKILRAISEAFDTDIFSEYEPQFWGFDTQKEWDSWREASAKKDQDEFYADLVNFVSDKPNGIRPGTVGECQAQIAKRLLEADPGLVLPERRAELMDKIETIYDRDHAIHVTLSDEEMALAQMTVTHEDNLPKA
ncbi:MAG: hypothetical protein WA884_19660 [Methyloceanibacter sp.]